MSENTSVYNELRLDQELCDVVIRVDSAEFHAHKVVMCNCSSYFRSLFTHWSTPNDQVFDIPDVSPDMMKIIIEFAYTGFVPVAPENVQELFIAADRFDVHGITKACCDFLEEQLTPNNCIGIWKLTDVYYNPELRSKAYVFILNYFEEVAAISEEFLLLSVQEVVQIIENDELNVKKEHKVFEAVMRWIAYTPEERTEHLPLLLSNVRLALINPEYFTENVAENDLVTANEECLQILLRAEQAMADPQTMRFHDSINYNPLARPRLPPAILLAVAGWSAGGPIANIEAYDVHADCWVNLAEKLEFPRAYSGTAFLDGSLYCLGGFDGVDYFCTVDRFDLDTRTWREVASMHSCRCYVSVTVMDGYIYAMGGFDGYGRLNTAERYLPSDNQWTEIAPMNEERSDASCTALHGKVYICGGFDGTDCLSTAESYNPETNQWTLIAPMSISRSGIGVVSFADHIVAVGGFSGTTRLHTAEAYNPNTNSWHALPSMMTPRSNFGMAVMDDCLFVAGGFNGFGTTHDVERFDAEAGVWSAVSKMGISRSALSCCVLSSFPNMRMYAAPRLSLELAINDDDDDEEEVDEVE